MTNEMNSAFAFMRARDECWQSLMSFLANNASVEEEKEPEGSSELPSPERLFAAAAAITTAAAATPDPAPAAATTAVVAASPAGSSPEELVVKTPPPARQEEEEEEEDEEEEEEEEEEEQQEEEDWSSEEEPKAPAPKPPKKKGAAEPKEREIPCLPCLKAALHGNGTGRCLEGSGKRCLRCFGGRSSKDCVPIAPVLWAFAAKLREELEGLNDKTRLGHLRTVVRGLIDHGNEVANDVLSSRPAAPAAPAPAPVPEPAAVDAPRALPECVVLKQPVVLFDLPPVAAVLPVAVAAPSGAGAPYEERKARLLEAVEPLVGEVLVAPLGRYLDKHMK
ncbi:hypothetical protein CH35J_008951 [Colletotrichum higginsianum]|uniref:Uncharacterized protein n=1 Tax=Colletotrichum higginsianum TaxID=80884 RepID=A0A4T0VSS5_9PEZI|nr:hypothetical protein CH35J_010788 [Colletotrichum higginsianum]TIC95630.1 hypothetical protein CH35J_008951 [Colletotrichum higginsianum]